MSNSGNQSSSSTSQNVKRNPLLQLIAGGAAGFVESSICHPLDTIKTRMQLRRQQTTIEAVRARSSLSEPNILHTRRLNSLSSLAEPKLSLKTDGGQKKNTMVASVHDPENMMRLTKTNNDSLVKHHTTTFTSHRPPVTASLGSIGTAKRIINREGFLSLYKGLTAVYTGIIPKMAIRFVSFEQYRDIFQSFSGPAPNGAEYSTPVTFVAGLASGLTEAVVIVTPAEVCKIRMQSQYHSMMDAAQLSRRKYTNVLQTAFTIVKEEGLGALYKGVVPTMLRQGINQAVNFTTYNMFKSKLLEKQSKKELDHWQSLILGGVSGGFGPLVNNPLDVVKTRMQKQVIKQGVEPKYKGIFQSISVIATEEGYLALWKGITPRLLRIMPGQAITFMTYEAVSSTLISRGYFA